MATDSEVTIEELASNAKEDEIPLLPAGHAKKKFSVCAIDLGEDIMVDVDEVYQGSVVAASQFQRLH